MPLAAGRIEVNQGTLTIKNLSPADSGLYDCVATNIMGTKKTRINVVVQRRSGLYLPILIRGLFIRSVTGLELILCDEAELSVCRDLLKRTSRYFPQHSHLRLVYYFSLL